MDFSAPDFSQHWPLGRGDDRVADRRDDDAQEQQALDELADRISAARSVL